MKDFAKLLGIIALAAVIGLMIGCKSDDDGGGGKSEPTVPGAVRSFTATAGKASAALSWTAPASNGGSAITGYEVTRDNWANKETKTASQTTHTFTGLTNDTEYTFKVRALNAKGAGAESTAKAKPSSTADTLVTFDTLTANGNATTTTTTLTLTFSAAITSLSASDITLSGVAGVTNGTLTNTTGGTYTLGISDFTAGGTLTVAVAKSGYNITPASKTVTIYHYTPGSAFVAVTNITGVPTTATIGTALTLTGTVEPSTATNKTIAWSVKSAGTTGATISGSSLNTTAAGSVTVTATIANGTAQGTNYTKDFTITVSAGGPIGPTWTAVSNSAFGSSDEIRKIAYGNNMFVAVGSYVKMATSPDGANWTAVEETDSTFGSSDYIYDIAYGDGRFIAVGGHKMAYSDDGATWTSVNPLTDNANNTSIYGIAYGDDKFIAVGAFDNYGTNKMISSTDKGATWTAKPNSAFGNYYPDNIAYDNGTWVAWGGEKGGKIATSPDGEEWTAVEDSTFDSAESSSDTITGIAYGGGKFVAVGTYVWTSPTGKMATSPDGEEWTAVEDTTFGWGTRIWGIAYGGGKFIAVGNSAGGSSYNPNGGKMATSTDGATWAAVTNYAITSSSIRSIAYGNKKFVIGGNNGMMAYSNDQE